LPEIRDSIVHADLRENFSATELESSSMTDRTLVYSGNYIDRLAEMRADRQALLHAFVHPETRFLPVWRDRCLVEADRPAMMVKDQILAHTDDPENAIFLGEFENRYLFAVTIESADESPLAAFGEFFGLRELTGIVNEPDAALLAYAKAMVSWRQRHAYCGICGAVSRSGEGGFVMQCENEDCGHRSFPRLDPAVIVLVHDANRCLLGRQTRWPEGQFSTIAGFVEPGESLEDAIRREVHEETNIQVGRCTYLASQPWPFPAALMIGYHAEALTDDIRLNDGELADAKWLSRNDIRDGAVALPPRYSIAFRLIETWLKENS
jgi:NAD+ diphosphatase